LRAPSALEAKILDQRERIEGERKQVTVMYTDVVGSMELTRALGAERWGMVLDRFLAIAAGAVHGLEGTVNQFTGDGLMAVFGAPLAHEDHARRACLAVLELQREVAALAAELARRDGVEFAVRCGLNSGEVIVGLIGDDLHLDFVPIGNTTALGRRIEALAPAGSTALSASTAALIEGEFELRDLGEFEIKGVQARQRVRELVGPGAARTRFAAVAARRGLTRFVGRDAERAQLESVLERTLVGDGGAIGIVGDPGVGKTRLVHEFVARCAARGLTVNSAGAVAHGRHAPFLPILALYRDYYGIGEPAAPEVARRRIASTMSALDPAFAADLPLLFEFLGVADPGQPLTTTDPEARRHRLLDIATRGIKARSRSEAAVLVIEDLQWIDDASAAFLQRMAEAVVGTRILLLCTYRPEHEPLWTNNGRHVRLSLGPLDATETDDLLGELLGRHRSLDRLATRIVGRAGGNPFFMEEIVQALAENGHLAGEPGQYRLGAELDSVALPPTVQAGLSARLDRLRPDEKVLVHLMSVIGQKIPGQLLREVCGLGENQLAEALESLGRAQLVVPDGGTRSGDYEFRHPLTQEVAYGSLLSQRRASAHRAVAAGIERVYPDGLDERAAILAHHYGASDDRLDAARWHARAAAWVELTSPADAMHHWRLVRHQTNGLDGVLEGDQLAAKARIGLLGMAWRLGMVPEEAAALHAEGRPADVERFRLDLNYAATLMHGGREREGLELFREVSRRAVATGDPDLVLTPACGVSYANWVAGTLTEAVAVIDAALRLTGGNPTAGAGLAFVSPHAHAFGHRGQALGYMGQLDEARHDFDRGVELAREHGDPEVESYRYANLALLEATTGATGDALRDAALGLEIANRSHNTIAIVALSTARAVAQAGSGHFAESLQQAEANLVTVRQQAMGLYFEPMLLATMARCTLALGRPDQALAAAEEALDIMDGRGLTTCALLAPITLAEVLMASRGAAAAERVEAVLAHATQTARHCQARIFEPQIHRQCAALARLRGDGIAGGDDSI
jgi:class 3 adenylate cyclase/tetratricopeptide (TPR) repeat protein